MPPKPATPEPPSLTGSQRARLAAAHRAREKAVDRATDARAKAVATPHRLYTEAIDAADAAYDATVAEIMRELADHAS